MWEFFQSNLLWSDGKQILGLLLVFAAIGYAWFRPLIVMSFLFFCFSLYFFRNPTRICPRAVNNTSILVCPCDGKVVDIQFDAENKLEGYAQKVSIFLSFLDAHVNWLPMNGVIKKIIYTPGQFTLAFLPKSSYLNEHNDIVIERFDGKKIMVRQIAGTFARRICCWVTEQESVIGGQKYGMIRFGSRIDIFMPANVTLAVGISQRVFGGQTVLGEWVGN